MHRAFAFFASLVSLLPMAANASSEEYVQLAYVHPHHPQVVANDARALYNDVNAARVRRGLPPLAFDAGLSNFALQVAEEMAQRHYFGHTDPDGVTFQDRLRAAGLIDRYAAENIAFDQDERHAHQAFLQSPDHYANIVDRHPHKLGVAAVAAGDGEVFYVEEFAD